MKAPEPGEKITWNGTKESFVIYVEVLQQTCSLKAGNNTLSIEEAGQLLLKAFNLDISPFTDFASLRKSVSSVPSTQETIELLVKAVSSELEAKGQSFESLPEESQDIQKWMVAQLVLRHLRNDSL